MTPSMSMFSSRRLLRQLYVEQLARARVSAHTPPADTTEVPIVVLVGYEGVGKGMSMTSRKQHFLGSFFSKHKKVYYVLS